MCECGQTRASDYTSQSHLITTLAMVDQYWGLIFNVSNNKFHGKGSGESVDFMMSKKMYKSVCVDVMRLYEATTCRICEVE